MATHAMTNADLAVGGSGTTLAAGKAHRALRDFITPRIGAAGKRLSAFGARTFALLIECREAQALAAIERYDAPLAARVRAERAAQANAS